MFSNIVYLNLPSFFTNVQLLFTFGFQVVHRIWNIKISFIPCGTSYLGKIEYILFTWLHGNVRQFSFNQLPQTACNISQQPVALFHLSIGKPRQRRPLANWPAKTTKSASGRSSLEISYTFNTNSKLTRIDSIVPVSRFRAKYVSHRVQRTTKAAHSAWAGPNLPSLRVLSTIAKMITWS